MPVMCYDYVDVERKASELGCNVPTGLTLLPRNFESATTKADLLHESSVADVRKLLREAGLSEPRLEQPGETIAQIGKKDATWIGPTMLFTAALLGQNPLVVQIAVKVVADYLSRRFLGTPRPRTVVLDVVVRKPSTGKYVRMHYEGDAASTTEIVRFTENILRGDG